MGNNDRKDDQRREEARAEIANALEFALEDAVTAQGGHLVKVNLSLNGFEVVMMLKALFDEKPMVGWVGGADMPGVVRKAVRALRANKVKWRPDEWATVK